MRDGFMSDGVATVFWLAVGVVVVGLALDWGWMWQAVLFSPLIIAGAAALYLFVLAPLYALLKHGTHDRP